LYGPFSLLLPPIKKVEPKQNQNQNQTQSSPLIPPAPASMPSLFPIRYEDVTAELTDITQADKQCFTGLQLQYMSVVENRFMFGHSFTAGKKDNRKQGEEKAGWAFQTVILPVPGLSLTGRYSSEVTSVGVNYDTFMGPLNLTINLSEQPEKNHWDIAFMTGLINSALTFRTQSFLFHSISWASTIWPGLSIGTEVQMLPWNPTSPLPQSRIRFSSSYALNAFRAAFLSFGTGNLGKLKHDLTLGYVRQITEIFQLATSYDIMTTPDNRIKSVAKLGYHMKYDSASGPYSVRGYIDTAWKLVCVAEQPLKEGLSLGYSTKFDFSKNVYDLGVTINLSNNTQNKDGLF